MIVMVWFLVEGNVNIYQVDRKGVIVLYWVVDVQQYQIVLYLFDMGLDFNVRMVKGVILLSLVYELFMIKDFVIKGVWIEDGEVWSLER